MFPNQIPFNAARPAWEEIPAAAGVFALFGEDARAEPYISRTPNLRRRLRRLLDARPDQSKRLHLAGRVARIEYALTGSDFEARLRLYEASLVGPWGESEEAAASQVAVTVTNGRGEQLSTRICNQSRYKTGDGGPLWAVSVAGCGGTVQRGHAGSVQAAAVRGGSGAGSGLSGMRVFGNEEVPGAVLQGLHG